MSGHSKWSQIKRQKSVADSARSNLFARLSRAIAYESKRTKGNISDPSLAAVIARAKTSNMPKENIERAIAKGVSKDSKDLEHIVYEVYGPGGVAILADAFSDNKNRTTQEIRHILSKNEIDLSPPGSTNWAFTKTGDSYIPNEPLVEISGDEEERLRVILELLNSHDDVQQVFTNARGYESSD